MSEQSRRGTHETLLWFLLASVAGVAVLSSLLLPSAVHNGRSVTFSVYTRLRQIDLAKQMWAEDHHATGTVQVTEHDLAPYLRRPAGSTGLVDAVIGETYKINPIGTGPEATLPRKLSSRLPKGAILRLRTNTPPLFDIIPPDTTGSGHKP